MDGKYGSNITFCFQHSVLVRSGLVLNLNEYPGICNFKYGL